jgi:parvulin-like peptidyl-prolyl isomerase
MTNRSLIPALLAVVAACSPRDSVPTEPPTSEPSTASRYHALRTGRAGAKAERTAEIVATVAGEPIYGAEIEPRGNAIRDVRSLAIARQHYLDNAIATRLMRLEAARLGVELTREDVDEIRKQAPAPAEIARLAAQQGITEHEWWRLREQRALHAKLRTREVDASIQIEDDELRREFAANAWRYPRPERVKLRHVFVALPAGVSQAEYAKQSRRLRDDVAALVESKGAGEVGDDLGWLAYQLGVDGYGEQILADPGLRNVAHTLAVGEVSAVVRSAHGLHVLICTDRRGEGAANFEDVRDRVARVVRTRRERQRLAEWMQQLHTRYDVDVLLER